MQCYSSWPQRSQGTFRQTTESAPRSFQGVLPRSPSDELASRRYLPSPNNLSVAVIRPIVGFALQYSPSFLALETNLSVSMTGGSFSSL
jgi:hypothetical protein